MPEGTSPGNLTALATDKNSMDSFLATAVEQLDEAPMTKYISLETNNFSLVVKWSEELFLTVLLIYQGQMWNQVVGIV